MSHTQSFLSAVGKKLFFRPSVKNRRLQRLWSMLHTAALYAMNYGGGGLIKTSGEEWVLANVVSPACAGLQTPIIFDVGANVGEYSLSVAKYLPNARIYAFEPSRSVFAELNETITEQKLEAQIMPFRLGLSDSPRVIDLYSYSADGVEASMMASVDLRRPTLAVDVQTTASEQIEVQTLDDFCAAQEIERIHFLKLDVEGHELAVLSGATRMLSAGAISMIQFEFGPTNIYSRTYFYDFWSLLSGRYDIYRILPFGLAPLTYYGEHREIFLTTNYFAVQRDHSS